MITIEKAAEQHADSYLDDPHHVGYDAFKAGAKFTQRWISVFDNPPSERIEIIAKNKYQKIVFKINTNDDLKYIREKFSYWRPLDYK